ncbi:unnamed protein product [Brassicogethes aeneus]|uniref:Protein Wnt n=1 Tax=Brassicogethes aeneus TaxID=1431903 RepID=A0A9P0BBA1_BRAAE|nr:unnamed protein product [Brassicogethes aeneus]
MNKELIESISSGVQLAMDQCKKDFKWEKWNCPDSFFSRHSLSSTTKETAYTKAILAAGIVHSITKKCSSKLLPGCGCDSQKMGPVFDNLENAKLTESDWIWGGCSDDVTYAVKVAKLFLNALEKGMASIGKHNFFIGKKIVQNALQKKCICTGILCPIQTCWMELPKFEDISKKIKLKYKKAAKAGWSKDSDHFENSSRKKIFGNPVLENEESLIYIESSPDYCVPNIIKDWPGTKGRICSRHRTKQTDFSERKSCKTLCKSCGYAVKKIIKTELKRCNCTFKWCCEVKCETCIEKIEEFICV